MLSLAWRAPSLFALGLSAAAPDAIAKARADAALPGSPGVVNALGGAFAALDVAFVALDVAFAAPDVAAPLAVGLVAARGGLGAALGCPPVRPLTRLALAGRGRRGARALAE
ncbi:MAG TPA: hypothetical protein VFS43_23120 [Polyangiaceae bacterium]|nr:hypothetical protein [Polyangiaceae bacterium]